MGFGRSKWCVTLQLTSDQRAVEKAPSGSVGYEM